MFTMLTVSVQRVRTLTAEAVGMSLVLQVFVDKPDKLKFHGMMVVLEFHQNDYNSS